MGFAEEIALAIAISSESPRPGITFRVVKAFIAAGYGRRGFEEFISVSTDSFVGVIVAATATTVISTKSSSLGAVGGGGRQADERTSAGGGVVTLLVKRRRPTHGGKNEECNSTEGEENARMHAENLNWARGRRSGKSFELLGTPALVGKVGMG